MCWSYVCQRKTGQETWNHTAAGYIADAATVTFGTIMVDVTGGDIIPAEPSSHRIDVLMVGHITEITTALYLYTEINHKVSEHARNQHCL